MTRAEWGIIRCVLENSETVGRHLRLTLAAEPVSVPAARRFVTDGLSSWGLDELLDEATLCLSELAGNAALHSASTFMHVDLRLLENVVRVSVEDDGAVPVQAVVPRPSFPGPEDPGELLLENEATTGRGLAIVSILASDWGVEKTQGGKRVWFEITDSTEQYGVRPPSSADDEPTERPETTLPAGWVRVRLAGCPVRLSLRQASRSTVPSMPRCSRSREENLCQLVVEPSCVRESFGSRDPVVEQRPLRLNRK